MTFDTVRVRVVAAVQTSLASLTVTAQQDERFQALDRQIERIYKDNEYALPRFGPARWLQDGTAYTTVERSGDGSDIVRYAAATGARSILISSAQLTPSGAQKPLTIADYVWSDDGSKLLIFTNTRKVWRQNTRGDYWVLNVKGGELKQVGAGAPEASLMFAKFSPDATRVGYVRGNNVYVERLDDGRVTQLTSDGSETTINGTSDWVYEEEFGLRDGFRWSPDGRSIAYFQFDSTGVG
ncbi:MAG: DPP IV N-terminal domain-containing protein, partial [Vicinamibacterales bacterium]